MSVTVFISHHSSSHMEAMALCEMLEAAKYRCWIAPRDIPPGMDWAGSIMLGIDRSSVMLFLDSPGACLSNHVTRELGFARSAGKRVVRVLMPGYSDDGPPCGALPVDTPVIDCSGGIEDGLQGIFRTLGPPASGRRSLLAVASFLLTVGLLASLFLLFSGGRGSQWPEDIDFIDVPSGSFIMGSPEDEPYRWSGEGPQVEVQVEGFEIMATEVTTAMWSSVMGTSQEDLVRISGRVLDPYLPENPGGDMPVVMVTWEDASRFAETLGLLDTLHIYRLPTEAEWEYACRAGCDGAVYGEDRGLTIDDVSWHVGNAGCRLHQAGLLESNSWGLYDMLGNVSELCLDPWRDDLTQVSGVASDTVSGRSGFRVQRGGSFVSSHRLHRCAFREMVREDIASHTVGFRVIRLPR